MSVHRFHPDPDRGDPPDALLFDDCERCAEQARNVYDLDDSKLRRLVDVHVKGGWDYRPPQAERAAANVVWKALLLYERLSGRDWRELVGAEVPA